MPYSSPSGKNEIREWVQSIIPAGAITIDVGAGSGTYAKLLGDHLIMDAVEIHEPYVSRFGLCELYRRVAIADAAGFGKPEFSPYQFAIFGDVIEHLAVPDAQRLLAAAGEVDAVLVCVPFLSEQGAAEGVESERHLQPDLTPELFDERFPGFEWLAWKFKRDGSLGGGYYARRQ